MMYAIPGPHYALRQDNNIVYIRGLRQTKRIFCSPLISVFASFNHRTKRIDRTRTKQQTRSKRKMFHYAASRRVAEE